MSPVSLALVKFLRRKSASDAMIKWPLSCIDAYIVNMNIKSNRTDTAANQKRRPNQTPPSLKKEKIQENASSLM